MTKVVDFKNLLLFSLTFIVFTIIGTLSHEFGHYLVAKSLGYDADIHYAYVSTNPMEKSEKMLQIYEENMEAIEAGQDFDQKETYEKGVKKLQIESILISLGGPLQTMLTGMIGLFWLLYGRSRGNAKEFRSKDWLAIFLSLFWLRQVANVTMSVIEGLIQPELGFFGGDELALSQDLGLWEGTISIITGILGLLVSTWVIFKAVPKVHRLTFILAGLLGGVLGFIFWIILIGPIILP